METKKKSKNKKGKKILIIAIVIIVIFLIFILPLFTKKNANIGYLTEKVTRRDIENYHSFTGNITAKEEQEVFAEVSAVKVNEVYVEKGDSVKKGDIICDLDTTSIDQQIEDLELQMSTAEKSNALSLKEASSNYNDYKTDLENGQNQNLVSARQQIDSTLEQWLQAKKAYDNQLSLNTMGYNSQLMNAMSNVDKAYNNLISARNSNSNTEYAKEWQKENAALDLSNTQRTYEDAVKSYEAAKIGVENDLTDLYDNVLKAQNSYDKALENYEITKNQVLRQLESYELNLEKANLNSDQTSNEIKLARLYDELEKCQVKAIRDGVITALDISEGDFTSQSNSIATITDYDLMKVEIKINEYDILSASEGEKVEVYVNALDKSYEGTITYIDRNATVDNGVSYFKSEVDFETDELIRSGMSVEIRLYTVNVKDVISIPTEAIMTKDDGTAYVIIKNDDGSQTEQAVEAGVTDGTYTEIVSGLEEGQNIYYSPNTSDMFSEMMMMGNGGGSEPKERPEE